MLRNGKHYGLCLVMLLGLLNAGFVHAASLSLNPASISAVESGSFDVDVILSDLGTDIVGAFDVTVGYDSSLVTATGITFGGSLGNALLGESVNGVDLSTPGSANAFEISLLFSFELDALQPGDSVQLATLSFLANNVGIASLAFSSWLISDDLGVEIPIQTVSGARVDISPVPLPGALWLMLSALFGIGTLLRKRGSAG